MDNKYELTELKGDCVGGACANISVTLAGFGARDVCVYTRMAEDEEGRALIDYYNEHGIDRVFQMNPSEYTGESIVVLSELTKQRMILVRRVTLDADAFPKDMDIVKDTGAQWVFMTSVGTGAQRILNSVADADGVSLTVILGKKEIDLLTAGKLSIPEGLGRTCAHAILMINRDEWDALKENQGKVRAAFNEIVVTDGTNGIRLDCGADGGRVTGGLDGWTHVPAVLVPDEEVADSSGAGDVSTASYSYARSLGADRVLSAKFAAVVSSLSVRKIGAHTGAADAGRRETLADIEALVLEKYVPRAATQTTD